MMKIVAAITIATAVAVQTASASQNFRELEDVWGRSPQIKVKNPDYGKPIYDTDGVTLKKCGRKNCKEPRFVRMDVKRVTRFGAAECVSTSGFDYVGESLLQDPTSTKENPKVEENDFMVVNLFGAGINYCRYLCQETQGCMFFTLGSGRCYLKGAGARKKKVNGKKSKQGGSCVPSSESPDTVDVPVVGEPVVDPCNQFTCGKECKGRLFVNKVPHNCGWSKNDKTTGADGTCVTGAKTGVNERRLGVCPTSAPTGSPTQAPTSAPTATPILCICNGKINDKGKGGNDCQSDSKSVPSKKFCYTDVNACQDGKTNGEKAVANSEYSYEACTQVTEEPVPPPPVCKNACKKFFKKMADEKVCEIKPDCQGCAKCVEILAGPTEAPVITAAPKYSKKCTKVSGKDWTSGKIGEYRTGSYSKCESKCIGDRSCKNFVFVKGSCHLFREVVKKGKVVNTMKNRKGHVGGICEISLDPTTTQEPITKA